MQCLDDVVGSSLRIFVLPDPDHLPAQFRKACVGITIATRVRLELPDPPFSIYLRDDLVRWAAVPEATINHDGHLPTGESDIHAPSRQAGDRVLHAKPQSTTVQLAAESDLGCSSYPLLPCESLAESAAGC